MCILLISSPLSGRQLMFAYYVFLLDGKFIMIGYRSYDTTILFVLSFHVPITRKLDLLSVSRFSDNSDALKHFLSCIALFLCVYRIQLYFVYLKLSNYKIETIFLKVKQREAHTSNLKWIHTPTKKQLQLECGICNLEDDWMLTKLYFEFTKE